MSKFNIFYDMNQSLFITLCSRFIDGLYLLSPFGEEAWCLLYPLIRRTYTVPVLVGSSQQSLSLQVDTGSSDLVRHIFLYS